MVKWKEEQYMEQLNVNLLQHFFHSTTFFNTAEISLSHSTF